MIDEICTGNARVMFGGRSLFMVPIVSMLQHARQRALSMAILEFLGKHAILTNNHIGDQVSLNGHSTR